MANLESDHSCRAVFIELERLVEVWKNLGNSYMNSEPITELITQKLAGLASINDNDLHGTSLKDLGRILDVRNTIVELEICSTRNYGELWEILDGFLKKMITFCSAIPLVHPERKSDLECLEVFEEWATLGTKMTKYSIFSPESSSLHDHVVVMKLNDLWNAFEKGIVVTDDVSSIKALEIAARWRDTLRPVFHMRIDKIIAEKLRILSIRQAVKSDPSLNGIVKFVQKSPAVPEEEQDNVNQNSNKQGIGFSNGGLEAAVSIVEPSNLNLNEQNFNTVACVHDHSRDSSSHPPPGIDRRALDDTIVRLSSRVTAGENKFKLAMETSDRSTRELEAENHDLILYIETLEDGFRKHEALFATLKVREAGLVVEIDDVREDNTKIKRELRQMTEIYEDRNAYAIGLHNDSVEARVFQVTKAVEMCKLKEEKEALTKELQEAKTIIDNMKQWLSQRPDEGVVSVRDGKSDQDDVVSYVPRREYPRSTGTVDNTLQKHPEDDNNTSSSWGGEATPTSSSVRFGEQCWEFMNTNS